MSYTGVIRSGLDIAVPRAYRFEAITTSPERLLGPAKLAVSPTVTPRLDRVLSPRGGLPTADQEWQTRCAPAGPTVVGPVVGTTLPGTTAADGACEEECSR